MSAENGLAGARLGRSSRLHAAAVLGAAVLNVVFVCALAGVVATQLDYQTVKEGSPSVCLLNVKGQVCVFTYITACAVGVFSLILIAALAVFNRAGAPLSGAYLSLLLFSFFWQLVMSVTITIRGRQATAASLPQQSSREAAWAFAWLGTVLCLLAAAVVTHDLWQQRQQRAKVARMASSQSLKIDSGDVLHAGVGMA